MILNVGNSTCFFLENSMFIFYLFAPNISQQCILETALLQTTATLASLLQRKQLRNNKHTSKTNGVLRRIFQKHFLLRNAQTLIYAFTWKMQPESLQPPPSTLSLSISGILHVSFVSTAALCVVFFNTRVHFPTCVNAIHFYFHLKCTHFHEISMESQLLTTNSFIFFKYIIVAFFFFPCATSFLFSHPYLLVSLSIQT